MTYSASHSLLAPVAKALDADALGIFCKAANDASELGYDHNACVTAGWDVVKKNYRRPAGGGKWVKKPKPDDDEELAEKLTNVEKRALEPMDGERSKTPFSYEGNVLGTLREDQVPRFFGALTDSESLPTKTVNLSDLTAMQNRVDSEKVSAIAENGASGGKLPVVVAHNGRQYIADGHHRLAAQWLNGDKTANVKFKDLEPVSNIMKRVKIEKVDDSLGLVFGWAIVCTEDGEDYIDTQGDHIPEDVMTKALADFAQNSRIAKDMHSGDPIGDIVFMYPLTSDIAKAMGIGCNKTGAMIAMKPSSGVLAKFKSGEYTGFSIGGVLTDYANGVVS